MYIGGIMGVIGAYFYENAVEVINPFLAVLIPFACSFFGSMLMALIYSFLTVTLRANQNVTGLALTTFGTGVGNFFGGSLSSLFGEGGSIALNCHGQPLQDPRCPLRTTWACSGRRSCRSGSWPTWPSPSPSRRSTSSTTRGPASACAPWARARPRPTPRAST